MDFSGFHVIAIISNPLQYNSRYNLYKIFAEDIVRKGAQLWALEMQTGARPHVITTKENKRHIQLWSSALPGILWQKENLINVGISHITSRNPDWRYIAWIDADIKVEAGHLEKVVQALQHWDVVQAWSHAIDLGPNGETINIQKSFMYCYWNNIVIPSANEYSVGSHPGYFWAIRREALNKVGRLIDWGILGSSDRHMACAFVGKVEHSVHGDMHPTYHKWLKIWQDRAELHLRRNVGYVPGTIRHMWHGKKANRGYSSRWKILVEHQFNPETDIKMDVSGLWQLVAETPRQISLRDDIRRYFAARNEDGIDV